MQWSRLNATQRASVSCGARYNRDTVANGKVVKLGAAKSAKAEALQTLRLLDRDARAARDKAGRALMDAALAEFTPAEIKALATKHDTGRAYGSRDLNRAKAGAMPMNYFRGTGYGS